MIDREKIVTWTDTDISNYFNYNIDWTKEPKKSLKELMRQHAQLIRDSYDYIILYFSGGSDSTTMVNAFLDNNIYVDEIVTITYDGLNYPCFDGMAAIHHLRSKNYNGIFNLVPIKFDNVVKFLRSSKSLTDWAQNFSGALHQLSRFSIEGLEKYGFSKPKMRNGNIAHVYGIEAPVVNKKEDHFYCVHSLIPEMFFTGIMYEHNNIRFFSSHQFPKLYVKQAHIIAQTLKKTNRNALSTEVIAKLIRDTYDPLVSPQKSNVLTLIKEPEKPTELNLLVGSYQKYDDRFRDTYFNSVVLHQSRVHNVTLHQSFVKLKYSLLF